jgi:hypothetical protein
MEKEAEARSSEEKTGDGLHQEVGLSSYIEF